MVHVRPMRAAPPAQPRARGAKRATLGRVGLVALAALWSLARPSWAAPAPDASPSPTVSEGAQAASSAEADAEGANPAPETHETPGAEAADPGASPRDPRATTSRAAPDDPWDALGDEPRDPNDSAHMRPPGGQLPNWSSEAPTGRRPVYDDRRRVQLTLSPLYGVFRWPFVGRGNAPIRGGGAEAQAEVQLLRWLWLRGSYGFTMHPVEDLAEVGDESLTPIARAGLIRASNAAVGLVYPLDLGRFLPIVEGGIGLMWLRTPDGVQDGQLGASCREEGLACEPGLSCNAESVCVMAPLPVVHAGIGIDILLGARWTVGAAVRYYALLTNPADFPVYYTGSIRAGLRF